MPEYPDVTVYVQAIEARVQGQPLTGVRLASPFLLRSAIPPLREAFGKRVTGMERLAKRIIFSLEDDFFLVLHLMVAGRLHWKEPGAKIPGRVGLCAFDFPNGTLTLTEASKKKRASLHLVRGRASLAAFDKGGVDAMSATPEQFTAALRKENHTLKRSLTDQRLLAAVGNAYSDEILHRAQLSPVRLTAQMSDAEVARLYQATRDVLEEWTKRLGAEAENGFPEKVTAFRAEMAVHGKYGQACPVCGTKVQRIVHADNETNYCPTCQTGGKLLADRALSRLLRKDWPKSLEELDEHIAARAMPAPAAAPAQAAEAAAAEAPAAEPSPRRKPSAKSPASAPAAEAVAASAPAASAVSSSAPRSRVPRPRAQGKPKART